MQIHIYAGLAAYTACMKVVVLQALFGMVRK